MPSFATNIPDLVKLAVIAYFGVLLINWLLRSAGMAQHTTRGV